MCKTQKVLLNHQLVAVVENVTATVSPAVTILDVVKLPSE
jgi:hypothetical protein